MAIVPLAVVLVACEPGTGTGDTTAATLDRDGALVLAVELCEGEALESITVQDEGGAVLWWSAEVPRARSARIETASVPGVGGGGRPVTAATATDVQVLARYRRDGRAASFDISRFPLGQLREGQLWANGGQTTEAEFERDVRKNLCFEGASNAVWPNFLILGYFAAGTVVGAFLGGRGLWRGWKRRRAARDSAPPGPMQSW